MADKEKIPASNLEILKALNKEGIFATDNRIPDQIAGDIAEIGERIMTFSPTRNNFMSALWGLMIQGKIYSTIFKSPLGILKQDPMRYGETEEEIFVNLIKGYAFDEFAGVNVLFGYYNDQVMAAFHTITPPIQYAMTLTFQNMRKAFPDEFGIRNLIQSKVQTMFSSAQYDEYLNTRAVLESAYAAGNVYAINVPSALTQENAENLTIMMKTYISMMHFPQPEYNLAGATSSSVDGGIFYMTTPDVDAFLDVKVLATAFHDGRVSLNANKIIVDKFTNPAIKAALFDLRWFKIRDNFEVTSESQNGAALSWNYFLTNSAMYSYSPFFTMIVFTTDTVGSEEIDVAATFTGTRDSYVKIDYTVTGDADYIPQAVDFMISGNKSTHTYMIPGTSLLRIGKDESSTAITVTITCRNYPDVTATTTVNVS